MGRPLATAREELIRTVMREGRVAIVPFLLLTAGRASLLPKRKSGRSRSSSNDTAAAVTARDGELGEADQQI